MSLAWPAFIAGRSLKRATANRAPGRHPMPCPCSRHPLSTRFAAARGRVCPLGLPARLRSHPRHRPGLSVRGGPMRVDGATTPEPIHQMARGPTSPPMPKPRPRGRPASPPPWLQKCTDGPDQPVSFLRPTELASADALADEPLGRGAATAWSRAAPKFLTTDRRGQRNPSYRWPLWIPRQHRLAVRAAGLRPRSLHHVGRNPQQHRSP